MEGVLHIDLLFANQSDTYNKAQFERNRANLIAEYKRCFVEYRECALKKAAVDKCINVNPFRAHCCAQRIQRVYIKYRSREVGALAIQRAYKNHYWKRCVAARKIAEVARRFISRRKANRMKILTIRIQARWRMIRETNRLKRRLADRASVKLDSQLTLCKRDGTLWKTPVTPQKGSLQDVMKIARYLSMCQLDQVCERVVRGLATVRPVQSAVYAIHTLQSIQRGQSNEMNENILNECPHKAETVDNDSYYSGLHDYMTITNGDLLRLLQSSLYYLPRLGISNHELLNYMIKMFQVQVYLEYSSNERRVHKVDGLDDLHEIIQEYGTKAETFWSVISKCRICRAVRGANSMYHSHGFECSSSACIDLGKNFCQKSLECGHLCQGAKTHSACMACIQETCEYGSSHLSCEICGSSLRESPCTKLNCGHIFHHSCLLNCISRVKSGSFDDWAGSFGTCPTCRVLIVNVGDSEIDPEIDILKGFDDEFSEKVVTWLRHMSKSQFDDMKNGDIFSFLLSCAVELKGDVCKQSQKHADSKSQPAPRVELAWAKGVGYGTGSTSYTDIWDVQAFIQTEKVRWATVGRLLTAALAYIDRMSSCTDETLRKVCDSIRKSNVMIVVENCLGLSSEDRANHVDAFSAVLTLVTKMASHEDLRSLITDRVLVMLHSLYKAQEILLKTASGDEDVYEDMEMIKSLLSKCMDGLQPTDRSSDSLNDQVFITKEVPSTGIPTPEVYSKLLKDKVLSFHDFRDEGDNAKFLHHFADMIECSHRLANKQKLKKLARDISDLTNNLPFHVDSSIFCAVDESHPDVIRFLVTGPKDTPYEGGCFQFDMHCPAQYPNDPPLVNMCTNGNQTMRFNPNLYEDGYVCLSLLNTWDGEDGESWDPKSSTLLQVLVSIQALIFVAEPYFNEPGYEDLSSQPEGREESAQYNREIREGTIRYAIIDQIKNPTPGFEDVIRTHFSLKRQEVLNTIQRWESDKLCDVSGYVDELKELLEKLPPLDK